LVYKQKDIIAFLTNACLLGGHLTHRNQTLPHVRQWVSFQGARE